MSAVVFKNRLIAMLDVLGFSNQLAYINKLQISASRYEEILTRAKQESFSPPAMNGSPNTSSSNFAVGEFVFDNVVLVSEDISPQSVSNFIFATTHLMEMFFAEKFPLRGAISMGDYYKGNDVF